MTRFWDGQTDGVTRLLDLLSLLATRVKICLNIHLNKQFIKTVCEIKYEVFESNICYFLKVNIPKGSYFPQHLTYLSLLCFCMLWSLFYNDASIKRISFQEIFRGFFSATTSRIHTIHSECINSPLSRKLHFLLLSIVNPTNMQ